MGSYIMVESSGLPESFEDGLKVSIETRVKYPSFIKKIVDIGSNYVNYTLYKVDDDKIPEALKIISARYHKIVAALPGYNYTTEIMLDIDDWIAVLK